MSSRLKLTLAGFGLLALVGAGYRAWAVNASPTVGSVMTWLGPTFGSDWVSPNTAAQGATCTNNIVGYGGKGDGATDNVTAWNAAVAVARCVYFPMGRYYFSAQISATLANGQVLTVVGDAPDTTTLYWPSGGGLRIVGTAQKTAFHIRDMSFLTGAPNTGIGIDADWGTVHNSGIASSTIDRIRVSGDPIGTNYWATGIRLNVIGNVDMSGVDVWGQVPGENLNPTQSIGLDIETIEGLPSFVFNIANSNFFGAKYGIKYGFGVQGVAIVNSNITNNSVGIYVAPSTFSTPQAQLSVTNSQFDNQVQSVFVDPDSTLSHLVFTANLVFIRTGGVGVQMAGGGQHTISSNHFTTVQTPYTLKGILIEHGDLGLVADNICVSLLTCVELNQIPARGWSPAKWQIKGNMIDGGSTTQRVVVNNTPPNTPNYITGFNDPAHLFYPNQFTITASSNVGGLIGLTLSPAMTGQLVRDQIVMVTVPGLSNQPGIYRVGSITDSTHVVLAGSAYGAATGQTDLGVLSVLP